MFPLKRGTWSALRACAQRQPPRILQGPSSATQKRNVLPWILAQRTYAADSSSSGSSSSGSSANTTTASGKNSPASPSIGIERIQELLGEATENIRLAQEKTQEDQADGVFNPDTNLLSPLETERTANGNGNGGVNNPFVPTDAEDKQVLDKLLLNLNSPPKTTTTAAATKAGKRASKIKPAPLAPSNANAPGARVTTGASAARKLFGPTASTTTSINPSVIGTATARYRLYVLAKRANCIMSLVNEKGETRAWASGGRVGFKGVGEGTYEAGYQCAVRMLDAVRAQIEIRANDPKEPVAVELEILMRGFGQGRTAILKALMLPEGDGVREIVQCITDRTQIKIGGVRLQKARRL